MRSNSPERDVDHLNLKRHTRFDYYILVYALLKCYHKSLLLSICAQFKSRDADNRLHILTIVANCVKLNAI